METSVGFAAMESSLPVESADGGTHCVSGVAPRRRSVYRRRGWVSESQRAVEEYAVGEPQCERAEEQLSQQLRSGIIGVTQPWPLTA
jgi:hypothetical protein